MNHEAIWKVVLSVLTLGLIPWWEKRKAERVEKERRAMEAQEAQVAQPAEPEPEPVRLLLIVEDNPNDVELLDYFLKRASHSGLEYRVDVEVTTNAQDAWTAFLQRHHQIVLVDMRLPGEPGWILAEKMRRHDFHTHVVIMAGHGEDIANLPKGQIFSVMLKPPTFEGVLQLLSR